MHISPTQKKEGTLRYRSAGLLSSDGGEVLATMASRIQEPVAGDSVEAFVDAQSRAAVRLISEIASAIEAQQR